MNKPQCLASIEVNGVVFFCGFDEHPSDFHMRVTSTPNRAGVTRIEWTTPPKPKRAKREKGGRRG